MNYCRVRVCRLFPYRRQSRHSFIGSRHRTKHAVCTSRSRLCTGTDGCKMPIKRDENTKGIRAAAAGAQKQTAKEL